MSQTDYDVIIIGGGISGTALLYMLARYADLPRIALLEKYPTLATVNTHARNNSQTLHVGDIETNYTLEKALHVRDTAQMVVNYVGNVARQQSVLFRYPKMVLAVGDDECHSLDSRYKRFETHFPAMQWLDAPAIAKVEPGVTENRRQTIAAIGIANEFSAVDFQRLANSFADQARKAGRQRVEIITATKTDTIRKDQDYYIVKTNKGKLRARFVVVSAGGHSLLFAQRMGYGMNFSCLPVAGSFYYSPKCLNGKVYTLQNDKLPFAAVHGDPDLLVDNKTRFGPTALILPVLERYNWKTLPEFLSTLRPDKHVFRVLMNLFGDRDIRRYMLKNMLFEVPVLRRHLFLDEVRKIVPSMRLNDLQFAHKIGGVRPIMIDKNEERLHLGEAKIDTGQGIIFNMTPSPGATSCLGNAEKDMRIICDYLHCRFDDERLRQELK